MGTLLQDTRYGLRMLRRNLRFTIVAVLTLGIGIGAITAIYSMIDALVLHPLPQRDSRQLVCFRSIEKQRGFAYPQVFAPIIEDISGQDALLSEVCYFAVGYTMRFERDDSIEEVRGSWVSPNFMTFWNTAPLLGRGFVVDEGKTGPEPVIVLSHGFWQTHCGGREDIIGQTIRLDEQTFTVVGVMPPHFRFPENDCDFWLPHTGFQEDANLWGVAARLRPGVSRARAQVQVQAMLDAIVPRHIQSLPTHGCSLNIVYTHAS